MRRHVRCLTIKTMDFKESKTYLLIFIVAIIVITLISFNIEDQIEQPDYYIRMRDD
jgi:hypothetical protein